MKRATSLILASLLGCTTLTSCVPALIGGATLGVISATDRRSTGAQTDDQVMEMRIQNSALDYLKANSTNSQFSPKLSVVSFNRKVLLLGIVASEADKVFVERVARAEPNAETVYNYIQVSQEGRDITKISDDSWITSKVRTKLTTTAGISANHVKVVTYNGITYVMGILTPQEQAIATQAVSTTAGVKQVVTLYETFVPNSK